MIRGAVDIGTNSVRWLVVGESEPVRRQVVTGLGRGADAKGNLTADSIERTVAALSMARHDFDRLEVERWEAVATSATRDAPNRRVFLDRAEEVLGGRPRVISGEEEAGLSFEGATAGVSREAVMVVDIGGGSTEFVATGRRVSIDIGSVRLTDRFLTTRPVPPGALEAAGALVEDLFSSVESFGGAVIGVAGTWTSLAGIVAASPGTVHGRILTAVDLDSLVARLAVLDLEETASLPGFDPARAPVILGGAVVARQAVRRLGVEAVTVSERDLLDGIIARIS